MDVRTYGTLHLNDDFLAGIDFLILSGESDCGSLGNGCGDEENHGEEGLHFDWEEGGQRVIEGECGGKMKRWYEIYNMRLFWGISKVICSKSGGRVSPSSDPWDSKSVEDGDWSSLCEFQIQFKEATDSRLTLRSIGKLKWNLGNPLASISE